MKAIAKANARGFSLVELLLALLIGCSLSGLLLQAVLAELTSGQRFARVLQACECDARGRLGLEESAYQQAERLLKAQQVALSVETAPIAQAAAAQGLKGPQIGEQISKARVKAVAASL